MPAATSTPPASPQPFMVSAPGKVIVFGEHAVVHGKAAMAATISLRAYLHVQPSPPDHDEPKVTLNFIDINLQHIWTISSLPWDAFREARTHALSDSSPASQLDPKLVEAMKPHVADVSSDLDGRAREINRSAASTFLYLYLLLSSPTASSISFTLRSTIPTGAGLGSSAAISVCLSAALLHLSSSALKLPHTSSISHASPELDEPPDDLSPRTDARATMDRINAFAFLGESMIHGTPSGVDNTVSTLGKAVIYRKGSTSSSPEQSSSPPPPPSITTLATFPQLPIMIVDTRQSKSTAAEVAKVRLLRETQPVVTEHILAAIDAITLGATDLIHDPLLKGDAQQLTQRIGALVSINHGLLYSLGVSHPRLEELKGIVDGKGAGWFKLTGAGGGGCGFVLLRPEFGVAAASGRDDAKDAVSTGGKHGAEEAASGTAPDVGAEQTALNGQHGSNGEHATQDESISQRLRSLQAELGARGFDEYETVLGGEGVGILLLDKDGEPLISRDDFLAAEGRKAIEDLCETGRGWRYWSAV